MRDLLLKYTKYNLWANTKLTGFLKQAAPEMLDKEIASSFNTIRKTVYHICDAENIWYSRLHGKSLSDWPSNSFKGKIEEFYKIFSEQDTDFMKFVENSSDESLAENLTYHSLNGKEFTDSISDIIIHCMNHSTFHRGQIVTMLRNAGFTELSSTDYISFIRIKDGLSA